MSKKILSLVLVVLLLNIMGVNSAYAAGSKEEKEVRFAEKVKSGIAEIGTGVEARVEVKLRNNTKLKGYVSRADTETFTVVDANGITTEVPYPQVKQVKGNNLPDGVRIAIGVGIAVGLHIIAALVFGGS